MVSHISYLNVFVKLAISNNEKYIGNSAVQNFWATSHLFIFD